MGLLNQVLFEIKELKKEDKELVIPPHVDKSNIYIYPRCIEKIEEVNFTRNSLVCLLVS
jgi:hypothetical protein